MMIKIKNLVIVATLLIPLLVVVTAVMQLILMLTFRDRTMFRTKLMMKVARNKWL